MGKTFLSPGIEGMFVKKNVELSQISLDDMSCMTDVSVRLFLNFVLPRKGVFFPLSQFDVPKTLLFVNQAV